MPDCLCASATSASLRLWRCNRFFGNYELESNRIKIGPIGATKMECQEPIMSARIGCYRRLKGPVVRRAGPLSRCTTMQEIQLSGLSGRARQALA